MLATVLATQIMVSHNGTNGYGNKGYLLNLFSSEGLHIPLMPSQSRHVGHAVIIGSDSGIIAYSLWTPFWRLNLNLLFFLIWLDVFTEVIKVVFKDLS